MDGKFQYTIQPELKSKAMFKDTKAFSGYSVNDIAKAKAFYSDILGLETKVAMEGIVLQLHINGGIPVMLYEKPSHKPATFTVLNFPVTDIKKAVQQLKDKGVKFESYDLPGVITDSDSISRSGGPKIAWFTDPAGNILSVLEE